jgi:alkyl hydroperoxide reductase subunit F
MYDLIIIGAGPGGVAAGIYAARKKIKTLLITDSFGGQSFVSNDIQNWVGTKSVSGYDFGKMLEEHLKAQEDIEVKENEWVSEIEKKPDGTFRVLTANGESFETRFILLSVGSKRRKLNIPGEKEFDGKGVVYCSTCDAPLFRDKVTVVVGGGNAGLEAAHDLLPYAKKIYVFSRSGELKGDPVTQEKILSSPKVEVLKKVEAVRIEGEKFVNKIVYKDESGAEHELPAEGVFVEIGSIPNSDLVKSLVNLNDRGEIVVDHKTQGTSQSGIWAVGDVSDVLYKQNNISAGDGVKAILNIYEKLMKSHALERAHETVQ